MIAALIGISYSGIAQQKTSKKLAAKSKECKNCKENKPSYTTRSVAMGGREATWQRLLNCSKAKRRVAVARKPVETRVAQVTTVQLPEPCYSYRKHNILVTECPDVMTDPMSQLQMSQLQMSSQSAYLGYYPGSRTIVPARPAIVTPRPDVSNGSGRGNGRGVAPQGGNIFSNPKYYYPNSSSR